jgi:hypothetical protein
MDVLPGPRPSHSTGLLRGLLSICAICASVMQNPRPGSDSRDPAAHLSAGGRAANFRRPLFVTYLPFTYLPM